MRYSKQYKNVNKFNMVLMKTHTFATISQRFHVQLQVTYPTHCFHELQSLPPGLLPSPLEVVGWPGGPGTQPVSVGSDYCHTEGSVSLTY